MFTVLINSSCAPCPILRFAQFVAVHAELANDLASDMNVYQKDTNLIFIQHLLELRVARPNSKAPCDIQ